MDREKFWQEIRNRIADNTRIIAGGLLGLIFAILILTLGISRAVLIAFLTLVGGLLGSRDSLQRDFWHLVERFFPGNLS